MDGNAGMTYLNEGLGLCERAQAHFDHTALEGICRWDTKLHRTVDVLK